MVVGQKWLRESMWRSRGQAGNGYWDEMIINRSNWNFRGNSSPAICFWGYYENRGSSGLRMKHFDWMESVAEESEL